MPNITNVKENRYVDLLICFKFVFQNDNEDGLVCRTLVMRHENLDLNEWKNEELFYKATKHLESYFKTLILTLCEKGYDVKYNERDRWFELGVTLTNHSLNEELIRHFIINNIQFYQTNKRKIEFF